MNKHGNTLTSTLYTLPNEGFLRLPNVVTVTGLAKSTIWEKARQGSFPKPIKLSERITGWRVEDIREWMKDPRAWAANNCTGGKNHE